MSYVTGTCSTYSKTLFLHHEGYPQTLQHGRGAQVLDMEGTAYVDWWNTLGSTILGHCNPVVNDAIRDQLFRGIVFSLPHYLEEATAETLCHMAGVEQLRWCKNGSDATEAAVRLARKVTGRKGIITTGYHGFHSDLVSATPGKYGGLLVESRDQVFPCSDPTALLRWLPNGKYACILAEPIFVDSTIWPWAEIKEACHKAGALLIFDEIVTGFRYGDGPALSAVAASPADTIEPDLYCFGKPIANGMPLACVAGPRALMEEYEQNVFFSSTASAECLSLAACKATLGLMQREPVHTHLWNVGQKLINGCKKLGLEVVGLPPRTQFRFPLDERRDHFLTGMVKRGHLLGRDNFMSYAHTETDVDSLLKAAGEVLSELEKRTPTQGLETT